MSLAAAQADAFYSEVLAKKRVYAIRDNGGFPAPMTADGARAMSCWSRRSRAEAVISKVAAYKEMDVVEVTLTEWLDRWLPGMERDGLRVGLNWSGPRAAGYDITPSDLLRNLDARRDTDEPPTATPRARGVRPN